MSERVWAISWARRSRFATASLLIGALLLFSSPAALAQFKQDGKKLVGMLATGASGQGAVSLSAGGDTAIVGGPGDNSGAGAAWVFARKGEVWTQQSGKLVGTGAVGASGQGAVSLSADGDTAIVGGPYDNSDTGAAWVYTRSGGVWTQQGSKLVGTGAVGAAYQGWSVALCADGNTAIVGGWGDNSDAGAAWVFTRSGGVWTQQGAKLVGTGAVGAAQLGGSVALDVHGDTAIVGGTQDNSQAGAAWVFTRSGGVWTQQGGKLVGKGAVGAAIQGVVALSADGGTAVVGGPHDNSFVGAAWVFTRSVGVWTQQGGKLVGTGGVGMQAQGASVSLSADGAAAILGGPWDNSYFGATWVFTRRGGVWTQQGVKLVGTGAAGDASQGVGVSLSADGDTAIEGGLYDNASTGAAWVFVQPLEVSPYTGIAASGVKGGPFSPSSFVYKLRATSGSVNYSITNVPSWLTASSTSGTLTTAWTTITFTINASADALAAGVHVGTIELNNADGVQSSIPRAATLTVKAAHLSRGAVRR
jgi:hypothetical protein